MTVIIGVTDGTRCVMVADSPVRKIVDYGNGVVIGCAGLAASIPVVRRCPIEPPTGDADEWAQDVAEALSVLLVAAGAVEEDNSSRFLGSLLLSWRGAMWEVEHNSAIRIERSYHAVGSGYEVAMGAVWALQMGDHTIDKIAALAAEAAREHIAGIGGPLVIAST